MKYLQHKKSKDWGFEPASFAGSDYYWVKHCLGHRLFDISQLNEIRCPSCNRKPPDEFKQILKVHHVLAKYEL